MHVLPVAYLHIREDDLLEQTGCLAAPPRPPGWAWAMLCTSRVPPGRSQPPFSARARVYRSERHVGVGAERDVERPR